jgi:transcriptional regulator with GAF, ATPase, and Fis domain
MKTLVTVLIAGALSGTGTFAGAAVQEFAIDKANCAAITPSLIASELFAYEKGVFTGSVQRHVGRFEETNGGTICLELALGLVNCS